MDVRDEVAVKDVEGLRLEMQQLRADFSAMSRTLKDIAGDRTSLPGMCTDPGSLDITTKPMRASASAPEKPRCRPSMPLKR